MMMMMIMMMMAMKDDDGEDDSGFMIYTTKRPINSGHFSNFPFLVTVPRKFKITLPTM